MKYLLIIIILIPFNALAQDTIDLFDCHSRALEGHPLSSEKVLLDQSGEIRIKNVSAEWYPSIDLNGQYTWQNEVVSFPFEGLPGLDVPEMPHYNYKLALDIQQTVYDGGLVNAKRGLEQTSLEVGRQQVEVNLGKLKEQVNQVFFQILVLRQQEKTLKLKLEVLEEKLAMLESGVRNEAIGITDLDALRVEILRVEQQLAEIGIGSGSALMILGKLTCQEFPPGVVLELPEAEIPGGSDKTRAEEILFGLQIEQLDAGRNLLSVQRRPRAFVFGQLGYGNPALNFFKDEFRSFYIVGAGLQWKVWDWHRTGRQKEDLAVQQDIIRSRQAAFDESLQVGIAELLADIRKYEEVMERDREIVRLRKEISDVAGSQYENGIITASDYIRELNAETEAMIMKDLHEIQLAYSKIRYLTHTGNI